MFYNVVLVSAVQQHESYVYVYVYPFLYEPPSHLPAVSLFKLRSYPLFSVLKLVFFLFTILKSQFEIVFFFLLFVTERKPADKCIQCHQSLDLRKKCFLFCLNQMIAKFWYPVSTQKDHLFTCNKNTSYHHASCWY